MKSIFRAIKKFLAKRKAKSALKIANREHKEYMNFLLTAAPTYSSGKIDLRRVRTAGKRVFYVPQDMLMLTMERKLKIEELQLALDYGMTREELNKFLEAIQVAVQKLPYAINDKKEHKKLVFEIMRETGELMHRANNIKSEAILLEIALLFFFIDGENPYELNPLIQKEKREIAMKDDALRAFFLKTTVLILKEQIETGIAGLER